MDYQIILDRLDELDDEIAEDLTPAIRVVEAMEKISAALNTSDTLEGMLILPEAKQGNRQGYH